MSAITFERYLSPGSTILEVGCANGRDARYWARRGHNVLAADFSQVALTQMMDLAQNQALDHKITPIHHDVSDGMLPDIDTPFNAFYARSALHINDDALEILAQQIDEKSKRTVSQGL